jgi:hypothetical protein
MSQNDFTIANQGFPAFRADLNSALQALATNNSGSSEPTTFPNMWWYNSGTNIMYIRNEDNDAWIKFAELQQATNKFVLSGALQLDDGSASTPAISFDADTNVGIYRGGTDILTFVTAGTDALTIDANQNLLVGKTTADVGATAGIELYAQADKLAVTRASGVTASFNLLTDDGTIVDFKKDGSPVGSINTEGSRLAIGTGDVGLKFDSGLNQLIPFDISSNAVNDDVITLGRSTSRFKNLYLSGGVYLGGTGSANLLSDYESGTFTPAFNSDSSPYPTVNYSVRTGTYTKIGNVVYYSIAIITSSVSGGSGNLTVSGLPFTTSGEHGLTVAFNFGWTANATTGVLALNNQTYLRLFRDASANSLNQVSDIHHTTGNVYLTVNGVAKVN